MSLGAQALALAVAEAAGELVGRTVEGVTAPASFPLDLLLCTRPDGEEERPLLRVVTEKGRSRLHLEWRPRRARKPGPLPLTLARRLTGRTIRALSCPPGERLVHLRFGPLGEESDPVVLVVELFGAGNWALLDPEGRITLCARPRGGRRPLAEGALYAPPPPRPPAEAEPLPPWLPPRAEGAGQAITAVYRPRDEEILRQRRRQAEAGTLRRALDRIRSRIGALEEQLAHTAEAYQLRRWGELIKANLGAIRPGMEAVTLTDWFDPDLPEVTIPLEPATPPRAMMERLFHRARRLDQGRAVVTARLERARELHHQARRALEAHAAGAELEALALDDLVRERLLPGGRTADRGGAKGLRATPGEGFRTFTAPDGCPILVGRNNKQNDRLTLHVARGNDVWLHVSGGVAGSHVVLRLPRGREPSPESLLAAAHLAVHYSKARGRPRVEVLWTRRKWVRKPKGAPPGQVRVDRSKTLLLEWDQGLFDRLLTGAE